MPRCLPVNLQGREAQGNQVEGMMSTYSMSTSRGPFAPALPSGGMATEFKTYSRMLSHGDFPVRYKDANGKPHDIGSAVDEKIQQLTTATLNKADNKSQYTSGIYANLGSSSPSTNTTDSVAGSIEAGSWLSDFGNVMVNRFIEPSSSASPDAAAKSSLILSIIGSLGKVMETGQPIVTDRYGQQLASDISQTASPPPSRESFVSVVNAIMSSDDYVNHWIGQEISKAAHRYIAELSGSAHPAWFTKVLTDWFKEGSSAMTNDLEGRIDSISTTTDTSGPVFDSRTRLIEALTTKIQSMAQSKNQAFVDAIDGTIRIDGGKDPINGALAKAFSELWQLITSNIATTSTSDDHALVAHLNEAVQGTFTKDPHDATVVVAITNALTQVFSTTKASLPAEPSEYSGFASKLYELVKPYPGLAKAVADQSSTRTPGEGISGLLKAVAEMLANVLSAPSSSLSSNLRSSQSYIEGVKLLHPDVASTKNSLESWWTSQGKSAYFSTDALHDLGDSMASGAIASNDQYEKINEWITKRYEQNTGVK